MPNRLVLIALAGLAAVLVMFALGQSGPDLDVPTAPGTIAPDVAVTPQVPPAGSGAPSTTAPPPVAAPSDYITDAAKMLIMLVIALGAGAYLVYNWWKDGRE